MTVRAVRMLMLPLLTACLLCASAAMACGFTALQMQDEALAFLQAEYPSRKFARGQAVDLVLMGDVELGLQNLRSKICLANPPMGPQARQGAMRVHFQAMMARLQERQPEVPGTWAQAKDRLMLDSSLKSSPERAGVCRVRRVGASALPLARHLLTCCIQDLCAQKRFVSSLGRRVLPTQTPPHDDHRTKKENPRPAPHHFRAGDTAAQP